MKLMSSTLVVLPARLAKARAWRDTGCLKRKLRRLLRLERLEDRWVPTVTVGTSFDGIDMHTTLKGATPEEVYAGRRPACKRPRFEPRPAWPRGARCAKPQVLVKGQPGIRLELCVAFVAQHRHLPRVTVDRAA
jgi:hypothetical protein